MVNETTPARGVTAPIRARIAETPSLPEHQIESGRRDEDLLTSEHTDFVFIEQVKEAARDVHAFAEIHLHLFRTRAINVPHGNAKGASPYDNILN